MRPLTRLLVSIAAVLAAVGCSAGGETSTQTAPLGSSGLAAAAPAGGSTATTASARRSVGAHVQPLQATTVAQGIPGAGAIAVVQPWHRGNPMHDSAALSWSAQPGGILEPNARLLVASSSNFGAPLARPNEAPGSVLSIDVNASGGTINPNFDADGSQASDLGGQVRMFSANNANYLNSIHTPGAATADLVSASLPTGISNNNGHGRPWYSNAPAGATGYGTITVIDPHGEPLLGGPDPVAGGVFAGDLTNRNAQTTHGLTDGALGIAIMTKSPDQSGKAVFASVLADGSVVQIHVKLGVDELAPAGTVHPVAKVDVEAMNSTNPLVIAREGMVFNWAPTRILYVADPYNNRIVALDLRDDGAIFYSKARSLRAPEFFLPVDIAPVIPETEADNFSSNTTAGAASDLYVLNRGNNTIVRISQTGEVQAVARIDTDVRGFRANGIAVSTRGDTIFVAGQTPNNGGVVLKMPAFGSNATVSGLYAAAHEAGQDGDLTSLGGFIFNHQFGLDEGVGPLFNGQACATCHSDPFSGGMGAVHDFRVGRIVDGQFQALHSPVTRQHSITELGGQCGLKTGVPRAAQVVGVRNTMTLRGTALMDDVSDKAILDAMAAEPAEVRGHPNYLPDGQIGRFGWKAQIPTLVEFMGDAMRTEIGETNNLDPKDLEDGCGANRDSPELDSMPLVATAKFLNSIDPPVPTSACLGSPGAQTFKDLGCASCHTPSMPGPGRTVNLYSDLLVHDMGPGLADGVTQDSASGSEFRTMTLWRVSDRNAFLHDGRAHSITEAIQDHGGQAAASAQAFGQLSQPEKDALLSFLSCI